MTMLRSAPTWPDYHAVWRWHFYAGLFCIPFVVFLALTGSIYLFRPQIEALLDRPYTHLTASGPRLPPSRIAATAVAQVPGGVLAGYQLPLRPQDAVQVLVSKGGAQTRLYINPYNGQSLHSVIETARPMQVLARLHGELLAGDRGSNLVELAACWAIVMILSGLYLWWPRGRSVLSLLWPRGGRWFVRDLHAAVGAWVSVFALFLLLTGLPWAHNWGHYLKDIRHLTHTDVARADWTTGSRDAEARVRKDDAATRRWLTHASRGGLSSDMPGMDMPPNAPYAPAAQTAAYASLDRAAPLVAAQILPAPVIIAPPSFAGGGWSARSDTANRPQRVTLDLSADGARILRRKPFGRRLWLDQLIGWGVAAHEGQLFGPLNVALGLLTATGLIALCVSSVWLWLRRRPVGALGAPPARAAPRGSLRLTALIVALAFICRCLVCR
jgi:uncharacterized iron-regulated membrane protein